MVSVHVLKRIAICGGIISFGGALYMRRKIQNNFQGQEFYSKSLELFFNYPPAVEKIGLLIKTKKVDLGDNSLNYSDGLNSRVAIPLKGSQGEGTLHSWASRPAAGDRWQVDKLDLETQNRQWTFYIHPEAKAKYRPTHEAQGEMLSDTNSMDSSQIESNVV